MRRRKERNSNHQPNIRYEDEEEEEDEVRYDESGANNRNDNQQQQQLEVIQSVRQSEVSEKIISRTRFQHQKSREQAQVRNY